MTPQFLVDENLCRGLVDSLEDYDLTATHVVEQLQPGVDDAAIASYVRAQDCVLVTNDTDFADEDLFSIQVLLVSDIREPAHETAEKIAELAELAPFEDLPRVIWL